MGNTCAAAGLALADADLIGSAERACPPPFLAGAECALFVEARTACFARGDFGFARVGWAARLTGFLTAFFAGLGLPLVVAANNGETMKSNLSRIKLIYLTP